MQHKETPTTGLHWFRRNKSFHDIDSQSIIVKTIIAKHAAFYNDAKLCHFIAVL
jgi:hypothetical protein